MKRNTNQRVAILTVCALIFAFVGAIPTRADSIAFGDVSQTVSGQTVSVRAATSSSPATSTGSLLAVNSPQTQTGSSVVETIQLGDINGTICNCGEIKAPAGFPLPLLGFAAIPLLFIHHHKIPTEVTPTPTPTPPTPVPEPATLLLLGSGLFAFGAGARRRARQRELRELNG